MKLFIFRKKSTFVVFGFWVNFGELLLLLILWLWVCSNFILMWRLILALEVFNLRRLSIESIYASLLILTVYVYTKIVVPIDLIEVLDFSRQF